MNEREIIDNTGIKLIEYPVELFEPDIPCDRIFQIMNENNLVVGVMQISELSKTTAYIEWIEILGIFRGRGYLRKVFRELNKLWKEIRFECSDELLPKYIAIGSEKQGDNDITEMNIMLFKEN